jgi:hypothetical protein
MFCFAILTEYFLTGCLLTQIPTKNREFICPSSNEHLSGSNSSIRVCRSSVNACKALRASYLSSQESSLPRDIPEPIPMDQKCDFLIQSYEPPYLSAETLDSMCLGTNLPFKRFIFQCLSSRLSQLDGVEETINRRCYLTTAKPRMGTSIHGVFENTGIQWICLLCVVVCWLSVCIIRGHSNPAQQNLYDTQTDFGMRSVEKESEV